MSKFALTATLIFSLGLLAFYPNTYNLNTDGNKYVGVKACVMCHKSEKQGEQQKIWENSDHANSYKSLLTAEADELAKAAGLETKAVESEMCLKCHATAYNVDQALLDEKFKIEDGIQCESCHGAGSNYKKMKTMKDHAASVAAGMTDYKSDEDIEKQCKTCHNPESPTYKEFVFAEKWAKIAHPVPAE